MSASIKVENLSKAYELGQIGTGTISRDLERWYAGIRGKEDPFLRIGESSNRNIKSASNIVWSLKDINFEIEQGDAVGIIGKNGAGKSTLLKILSKVTAPTTGKIWGKGRIASLLEVGTGFHPELSGRENIFLNGAILGMRKKEIQHKLDEIVDFAGIERYLDTPVKRYSSGMYVRLAFAVAAHLESEILIVDEVLAVGDAEFQKKCLNKMNEVSKGEGRTVLFVSHNMGSIAKLCNNSLLLENGQVWLYSDTSKAITEYNQICSLATSREYFGFGIIKNIVVVSEDRNINYSSSLKISTTFKMEIPIANITLGIVIKDTFGVSLIGINNRHYQSQPINKNPTNQGVININIRNITLMSGNYTIDVFLGDSTTDLEIIENAVSFTINDSNVNKTNHPLDPSINKLFIENILWDYEKI